MNSELTYEKAFERLEKILTTLNEGKASLEDSLTLFKEANQLIMECNQKLTHAEQTIERLIKHRDGSLVLDETNTPKTSLFEDSAKDIFTKQDALDE